VVEKRGRAQVDHPEVAASTADRSIRHPRTLEPEAGIERIAGTNLPVLPRTRTKPSTQRFSGYAALGTVLLNRHGLVPASILRPDSGKILVAGAASTSAWIQANPIS
jgi:hypothetical protein